MVNHEKLRALELALKFLSCPDVRIDERFSGDVLRTPDVVFSLAEKFLAWASRGPTDELGEKK